MVIVGTIIYTLTLFIFVIVFFGTWYRLRKQVKPYLGIGFLMGIIFIGFELVTLVILFVNGGMPSLIEILIIDSIAFFRLVAFTVVGIHCCATIGIASFPLLMGQSGTLQTEPDETGDEETPLKPEEHLDQALPETSLDRSDSASPETSAKAIVPKIDMRQYITSILAVVAGGVIFSSILFFMTTPQLSNIMKQHFGLNPANVSASQANVLMIIVSLVFAFIEEIMFRLGIQNFLAQKFNWVGEKYWFAILATTILWTLGHVGVLTPDWVKLVQIFPLGIALGWLFKKYGVESTMIAHGTFNIIMLVLGDYLIRY